MDIKKSTEIPCIEVSTSLLFLKYETKDEVLRIKDELWTKSKASYKERLCTGCNSWHLFDDFGRGLTGNQRLTYRQTHHRELIGDHRGRGKCSFCKGTSGKSKTIFENLLEAQQVIDSLTERLEYPLWAYKCPHGHGTHLTKKAQEQSIGLISQKGVTRTTYEIVEVRTPAQILAPVNPPTHNRIEKNKSDFISSPAKVSTEMGRIVCQSCGYKLNRDPLLKCAFCGQPGPYDTTGTTS